MASLAISSCAIGAPSKKTDQEKGPVDAFAKRGRWTMVPNAATMLAKQVANVASTHNKSTNYFGQPHGIMILMDPLRSWVISLFQHPSMPAPTLGSILSITPSGVT